MPVDLGDYATLPDVKKDSGSTDLGDYGSLPDTQPKANLGDYASLPDLKQSQSKTPELDKAVAQTARLQKLGVDTQPPEASFRSIPSLERPLASVGKAAVGLVKGLPEQMSMTADPWGPDTLKKIALGGVATAVQIHTVQNSQPFSQQWWDAVVPLTAQVAGEVSGVRASAPSLAKPPIQEGIPNASKVGSATEVPVREVRGEVGKEAPLQQQGETAGKETTIPPQAETVLVEPKGGEVNEAQKARSETVESNQPQGAVPQHGVEQGPVSEGQPQDGGQSSGKLRDEVSDVKGEGEQTPPPAPTHDEPVISAIANKYTQERSGRGDLGVVEPGRGTSAAELATRGQKIVEQHGEGVVDQAVSRVMSGTFDPVNDAAVVRFQEARLRVKKDIAYRELQKQPQNPALQINYDNAFKDLTDFHKGPIAQVKGNWAEAGRGLQGQFPVDVSTADGIREAWLQATGEDAPAGVKSTMQKVADRVKRSVDAENGQKARLGDQIEQDFAKSKQKSHEAIRDRFMKELENRPCR